MIMIENRRVPVQVLLGSGRIFPTVMEPAIHWELVARHEGDIDAVNWIFRL